MLFVVESADKNKHDGLMVEYDEDGEVLPSTRGWIASKKLHPTYCEAEPLLYFLDKYTTIIIGGSKAMAEYNKTNKGKTLLDRVTVSDIAYSMLVYESSYDVWMEEIVKNKTCTSREEKKEFKHVALNKYHAQRGARLGVYTDGWTNDGREHFNSLCDEIQDMMKAEELWSTLQLHWDAYVKKYHKYIYVHNEKRSVDNSDDAETLDNEDDDDCVVFLPGDEDDLIDREEWDDGVDMQGRKKRAKVVPV